MKRVTKVCFIAFVSLLILTPLVACGGAEAPPPATGNQPPVISLTAEETTLIPNAETGITCDASDPDGDELTYTWSATGGTISGVGEIVTWKAPGFVGEFEVSVTVDDGKGHTVSQSCTITVQATQRPVIDSVTAEPAKLEREETSTVTCIASDPDDDELTYIWSASGGTISGVGKTATWKAPAITGEFLISVRVDDGKGGITESSCSIVVATPEITLILAPLPDESGSVYFNGDIITQFRIGDNAKNVGMRPYFSFDITGLAGAEIKQAKLTFTVRETFGYPWLISPRLYADSVDIVGSPRALKAADFDAMTLGELQRYNSQPPGEIDVRERLTNTLKWAKPRFQVRLRLDTNNNLNKQEDYIEFSTAELTVIYVK
jgi:hypothetical protein